MKFYQTKIKINLTDNENLTNFLVVIVTLYASLIKKIYKHSVL